MSRPPQRWTAHHNDRGAILPEILLTLVCYGSNSVLSSLRVQVLASLDGLEVLIQLVVQRNTGGDVQASNVLIGKTLEVLNQRTQGVTVCSNQNGLTCCEVGLDVRLPVQKPCRERNEPPTSTVDGSSQ